MLVDLFVESIADVEEVVNLAGVLTGVDHFVLGDSGLGDQYLVVEVHVSETQVVAVPVDVVQFVHVYAVQTVVHYLVDPLGIGLFSAGTPQNEVLDETHLLPLQF